MVKLLLTPDEFDKLYQDHFRHVHELMEKGYIAQQLMPLCHRLIGIKDLCYSDIITDHPEVYYNTIVLSNAHINFSSSDSEVFSKEATSISYRLLNGCGVCQWFAHFSNEGDSPNDWKIFKGGYLYHQLLDKPRGYVGLVEVIPGAEPEFIQLVNFK